MRKKVDVEEVAENLHLKPARIYQLIKEDKLRGVRRYGRRIMFDEEELEAGLKDFEPGDETERAA